MTRAKLPAEPPTRASAKETLLEFGPRVPAPASSKPESAEPSPKPEAADASPKASREAPMRCPHCGQHFSAEGRFCPFDREPLVRAVDWDPTGDPMLGQVIDQRYAVEAVIGEGGMGRVYRVRHVSLGKRFALKALRKDLASDGEIAARFIHEARTAASVTHPGLVQISDFGHLPTGQAYFVMELLEGVPLSALLRRYGALPAKRAVHIASKIAEALAVAHEAGVVHRDLKPDNVHVRALDDRDEIKIVDFGLAKVLGASRLTRDGVVFGTPYYMSPEQASGEATDHRADIYALGVVLYEMLTGRVPFEADTYMGVLTKHIYMKPVPPGEVLGLDGQLGGLEPVVLRCLEKRPEKRFGKLAELQAALGALSADALELLASPRVPPRPYDPAREELSTQAFDVVPTRRFPVWMGALLLVASAGLGALLVARFVTPAPTAGSSSPPRTVKPDAPPVVASPPRTAETPAPNAVLVPPHASPSAESSTEPAPPVASAPRAPAPRQKVPSKPLHRPVRRADGIIDPWAK